MEADSRQTKSAMSQQHKQALAAGRDQGRTVRHYLEALQAHKPKRGRKRSQESIQRRLDAIAEKLPNANALTRVQLLQERMNLQAELEAKSSVIDLTALEEEFINSARSYAERKGISYSAWREAGVDANVLKKAGIRRSGD